MFFLNALFRGNETLDLKKRMQLKMRLEAQQHYYSEKINFLASKKKSPQLALLTCRDAPIALKHTKDNAGRKRYLHSCSKYYQKRLQQITLKLKKI